MNANIRYTVAVHILTLLANHHEPLPSGHLAASAGVNPVTVRKLAGALRQAGLIKTRAGSRGGAVLGRPASQISLGEVYRLVNDTRPFGASPDSPDPECLVGRNVQPVLEGVLAEAERHMVAQLDTVSIFDVLKRVQQRDQSPLRRR